MILVVVHLHKYMIDNHQHVLLNYKIVIYMVMIQVII